MGGKRERHLRAVRVIPSAIEIDDRQQFRVFIIG
jgi:hypothetical protein